MFISERILFPVAL